MIVNKILDVAEDDELIGAWYFSIWLTVYGLNIGINFRMGGGILNMASLVPV